MLRSKLAAKVTSRHEQLSSGVSSSGISGPCSAEYAQLAEQHAGECAKTFEEYEADMERYKILRDVGETGLPQKGDEREDTGLYFRY
ncbi:hypothetical protein GN958_ATG20285 [Phytophthora infestans]|uniref:Uncharacterized protein n=1 Tax=Phytophthora infestans TaxID=4787 RepID=A0A8S9TX96_PHYIN|nr:hypothetical protein GN958_ATG20285 [Phytophthora infestans]